VVVLALLALLELILGDVAAVAPVSDDADLAAALDDAVYELPRRLVEVDALDAQLGRAVDP
jgi:hypothetical protein